MDKNKCLVKFLHELADKIENNKIKEKNLQLVAEFYFS
jgi:hypothetical protein